MSGGLRKRPSKPYDVRVPSTTARDTQISYRALGVLTWILDQADGWEIRSEQMSTVGRKPDGTGPGGKKHKREGREAIRTVLRELAEAGYYRLERQRMLDGTMAMGTAVSEVPVAAWAEQHALFNRRAVPVIEQPDGSFHVRYPDGTLRPDDWPADEIQEPPAAGLPREPLDDELDDPGPDRDFDCEDPGSDVTAGQTGDGFPGPGATGDGKSGPGSPGPGSPGPGNTAPLVELPMKWGHEVGKINPPPTPTVIDTATVGPVETQGGDISSNEQTPNQADIEAAAVELAALAAKPRWTPAATAKALAELLAEGRRSWPTIVLVARRAAADRATLFPGRLTRGLIPDEWWTEATPPAARAQTPVLPWCGECDADDYRWVETGAGYAKCRACNPSVATPVTT